MTYRFTGKHQPGGTTVPRTFEVSGVRPENVIAKAIELCAWRHGWLGFNWDRS